MNEIYNGIFCSLHFPAADRLKKSFQLLICMNETHTVIPDMHVLQVVVVERVLHVQRSPILKRKIPISVNSFSFISVRSDYFVITHAVWDFPFLPALTDKFIPW